ncbi:hypothetical protein DXG03_003154 [Asterophora parasitica]|uniref:Gelsolin n=1 Tax=Asterophora parasitica TaxID=117018 RepID=A0A9P7GH79_9AGAR|nr:hypothetical protein DXG03_003154 [Asterophora parasitica]
MTTQRSSSRSHADAPELKPEAGLAEWTNKIKALQRQVDADEEAEQSRLEEEIAASRLARIRRSQGLAGGRSTSDVSKLKEGTEDSSCREPDATSMDTPKSSAERQFNQTDALERLTGAPTTSASTSKHSVSDRFSPSTRQLDGTKPEAISLAAFMGGRATGPRLNKHAPQQDVHDPTQFQQRTFDYAPHPTFGTGGVAMPGIAVLRDGPVKVSAVTAQAKAKSSGRVSELPPTTKPYSETYERQPPITRSQDIRERTVSTPYASSTPSTWAKPLKRSSPATTPRLSSTSSTFGVTGHHRDSRSVSPILPKPSSHPTTAPESADITSTPHAKSPVIIPSLAGPIRPQPRQSIGPHIPPSAIPSKAFMRPPPQKEPTPSLSRLQGRGFVQSMVQVSSNLESPIPEATEKVKPNSGRKSSVLDRWQPNVSNSTTSPPPSPDPRAVRRSFTVDPAMEKPKPFPPEPDRKPLKPAISNPSLRQENIPPRPSPPSKPSGEDKSPAVGLGSATTLVVFKPKPIEVPPVDEFGSKLSGVSQGGAKDAGFDLPAPSKPLSHPTKERARKPRKSKPSPQGTSSTHAAPDPRSRGFSQAPDLVNESTIGTLTAPPPSESERDSPIEIAIASTKAPLPLTSTGGSRGKPTDQIRRALPGLARQRDEAAPTPKPSFKAEQPPANRLVRYALPGLASLQVNEKLTWSKPTRQQLPRAEATSTRVERIALPVMVAPNPASDEPSESTPLAQSLPHSPLVNTSPLDRRKEFIPVPPSPQGTRIPSTGNRPTVMEVAEALSDSKGSSEEPQAIPGSQAVAPNRPRNLAPSPAHTEKRKSSYEKYSSIILPPLKEEATPTPTPAGTLPRREGDVQQQALENEKDTTVKKPSGSASIPGQRLPPPVVSKPTSDSKSTPPGFNIEPLLKYNTRPVQLEPGTTTISVEVMAITGTTASNVTKDLAIFYDTEILAIIHRSKSKLSGLVSTAVWGWEGKRATLGEREQRKLQELAQRYGTTTNVVHQHLEPSLLVHVLGGVLAIRQGTRAHWSSDNTAMHLVRSLGGVIVVDEKDLNVTNLCSAYSYCVSILDSVYVWYGHGSTPTERKAALEYGQNLKTSMPPIELTEDESANDEMFWMILGNEDYANADYWKWRRSSSIADPRIWRVRADLGKDSVTSVDFFSHETDIHDSVYIIDCIWEFYVVVGSDARAHRKDIELALRVSSVSVSYARGA